MTHPEDLLSAFLDGELDERARAEVTAHLAGCAECRAHLEDLGAVDALARRTDVAAPPGYFDGLTGRLRPRLRSVRRRTPPAPWVWAAAAGILLAVLAPMTMQTFTRARIPAPVAAPEAAPAATLGPAAPAPSGLGALGYVTPPAGGSAQALPNATPPRAQDSARQDAPPERRLRQSARSEKLAGGRFGSVDEVRPPAAPPPPAPAAPAEKRAKAQGQEQDAFAQPPATVVAETVEVTRDSMSEEKASADKRSDRPAGLTRSAPAAANAAAPPEAGSAAKKSDAKEKQEGAAFRELEAATPRSAADARRVRDSWRAFARAHPGTAEGDEAKVRAVEAGLLAWRLGHDSADLEAARGEGRAYLADPGALQAERVRRALAAVP